MLFLFLMIVGIIFTVSAIILFIIIGVKESKKKVERETESHKTETDSAIAEDPRFTFFPKKTFWQHHGSKKIRYKYKTSAVDRIWNSYIDKQNLLEDIVIEWQDTINKHISNEAKLKNRWAMVSAVKNAAFDEGEIKTALPVLHKWSASQERKDCLNIYELNYLHDKDSYSEKSKIEIYKEYEDLQQQMIKLYVAQSTIKDLDASLKDKVSSLLIADIRCYNNQNYLKTYFYFSNISGYKTK